MGKTLYVGNLNYATSEDDLKELFSRFGEVTAITLRAEKGFGFVEMTVAAEAATAMSELNGSDFLERPIRIEEARPRRERRRR